MADKKSIYIAGPMRGYPGFNFPAFDAAAEALRLQGWRVVSPADLDRELGFDPLKDPGREVTPAFIRRCVLRDAEALTEVSCLALLPDWERSAGACAELALARWMSLDIYRYIPQTGALISYPPEEDLPVTTACEDIADSIRKEDILEEALRITKGDRNASYGPPDQDFQRTAKMWGALKGVEFSARDVAMFMICLKLSRETHQKKRDNWVDAAGYARCGSLCSD